MNLKLRSFETASSDRQQDRAAAEQANAKCNENETNGCKRLVQLDNSLLCWTRLDRHRIQDLTNHRDVNETIQFVNSHCHT